MLIYKLKQNSKQQTGLNYVIYVEMTNLKFSLTSQCHETAILLTIFKKEKSYLARYCLTASQ